MDGAAAKESAERPFLFFASTSAPFLSRSLMMSTRPSSDAFISGVHPEYLSSGSRCSFKLGQGVVTAECLKDWATQKASPDCRAEREPSRKEEGDEIPPFVADPVAPTWTIANLAGLCIFSAVMPTNTPLQRRWNVCVCNHNVCPLPQMETCLSSPCCRQGSSQSSC